MKTAIGIILTIAVLAALYLSQRAKDSPTAQPADLGVPEPIATQSPPHALNQKRVYQAPREVLIPENPSLSGACRNFWQEIMTLDLSDARIFNEPSRLPSTKGCMAITEFQALQKSYEADCLASAGQTMTEANQQKCQFALFYFRANLHDFFTKDLRVDQISDPTVLIDKLFARFLKNPLNAVEVADRLVELQPDYYPAAQAQVLAKLVNHLNAGKKIVADSPEIAEISAGLEKLSRMKPNDPQNAEIDILLASLVDENTKQVKRKAAEMMEHDPHSATAAYYLAWSEYKSGDPVKGAEWLKRSAELAPNDPRIKATIERVKVNPQFYKSQDPKVRSVFEAKFRFDLLPPDL